MHLDSDARAIARAGIRAVDPGRAVRAIVHRRRSGWVVAGRPLVVGAGGRLRVIGLGKAAAAMADAVVDEGGRDVEGVIAVPRGYPGPNSGVRVVWGNHPVPGPGSLRAGRALLQEVQSADPSDCLLFLISGGGSAVVEVPAAPLSLTDLARTTEVLLGSNAPIQSMNAIRRHVSAIKGGQLAPLGRPGRFSTVAISDVVGDTPEDIASGPTVPDPTTFAHALRAADRFGVRRRLPPRVVSYLVEGARGGYPETPKPSDPRFRGARFEFAATNRTALEAAAHAARERGYVPHIVSSSLVGETRTAARRFTHELVHGSGGRARAILSGGETTVTLGPRPGRGGRNQEFALAAAHPLIGRGDCLVLSVGTDGIDGPTDAAGGWVDGGTVARARERGVDLAAALRQHASYDALERLGSLVRTGPTGTNVMDLHVGLRRPQSG
ncbi:MAG: glycerate kinase [Thermoplasmata archaeon]